MAHSFLTPLVPEKGATFIIQQEAAAIFAQFVLSSTERNVDYLDDLLNSPLERERPWKLSEFNP